MLEVREAIPLLELLVALKVAMVEAETLKENIETYYDYSDCPCCVQDDDDMNDYY